MSDVQHGATVGAGIAARATPVMTARLSEISFSDIYLSTDPQAPLLALNVTGINLGVAGLERAPRSLPDIFRADAANLLAEVERKWAAERFLPEFTHAFDGVRYRCSQISAPVSMAAEPRESARVGDRRNWCLRRIDAAQMSLAALGLPSWCAEEITGLGASSGLLLVAGAFASGKTTTSAACLRQWVDKHGGVGVTIEDPPEKMLEGYYEGGQIYQIAVRDNAVADAIRASRRWAYRYLFLGEVRDQTGAEELLQIALGGPMVLTTIHAAGAVEALMALSKFGAGRGGAEAVNDRIAACVLGVVWQSITKGRLEVQYLSFRGRNAAAMRTKISDGRFRLLREDLAFQTNLRNLGRFAESF